MHRRLERKAAVVTGGSTGIGLGMAAIRNFARHWTLDLKERHIRVNALSPGSTLTPGSKRLTADESQWQQFQVQLAAQVPMGRLAHPEEIGRAAVFLASDDSSYVNGMALCVDGGVAQI